MAVKNNYPTIRPSLDLNFAGSKTVDPRVTFTRASTATYYDGKTVAKAEENLLTYSQQFDNATWTKVNATVTANTTVAPDGTSTAETLTDTAATTEFDVYRNATSQVGSLTFSVYLKAGTLGYGFAQIATDGTTKRYSVLINLSTGAFVTSNSTGEPVSTSYAISDAGNGWWRLSVTATNTSGYVFVYAGLSDTTSPVWSFGQAKYTGTGTGSISIWGAQLEQRDQATAYTPTTDQPITRYQPVLMTAAANTPRIDHDPITGECKGLLIEESRTNLFSASEFPNGLSGVGRSGVTMSGMFGPDGRFVNAIRFETAAAYAYVNGGLTPDSTYTLSVYVKMHDGLPPAVSSADASRPENDFSLVIGNNRAVGPYLVQPCGNGLYRVSGTAAASGVFTVNSGVAKSASNSQRGFTTTGWQIELGSFPTSYIPTTAAQVTRAADNAVMTGTNFSSWYRQDEGSFYAEVIGGNTVDTDSGGAASLNVAPVLGIGTSLTNQFRLDRSDASTRVYRPVMLYRNNLINVGVEITVDNSYAPGKITKMAAAMRAYDYAFSVQGLTAVALTTPSSVIQGPLLIGRSPYDVGTTHINGHIKRLTYYPKRLSNAQLQALTL